jgi:Tfp pilus assembly protein PilF
MLELGSYMESLGKLDEASKQYEDALALDPKNALAKNNLAWALAATKDVNEDTLQRAQVLAQSAVDTSPREPAFKDTLGFVMLQRNRSRAAVPILQEALDMLAMPSPLRSITRYHLALAYEANGNAPAAREQVTKALSESPDFPGRGDAEALRERLR